MNMLKKNRVVGMLPGLGHAFGCKDYCGSTALAKGNGRVKRLADIESGLQGLAWQGRIAQTLEELSEQGQART